MKHYDKFLAVFLLFTLLSCKKNDEVQELSGEGKIRGVNTVVASDAQFLFYQDTKLGNVPLRYGDYNETYFNVAAGNVQVSFRNEKNQATTASANGGIYPGSAFTVFYYATSDGKGAITALEDNNNAPASGKYKVRFLNLSNVFNNTININVPGSTVLVTGLSYYKYTDYFILDSRSSLDISVNGSQVKVNMASSLFQEGKIYTVWLDAVSPTECRYHLVLQN